MAIPLQLEKQWITIGWALEGAALVWLFRRIPHRGLLAWAGGAARGGVRAARRSIRRCFDYHPRSARAIFNWYLYTYLVCAAAFFAAAWLLPTTDASEAAAVARRAATRAGPMLLFLLLNIEIADFYSTGPTLTFNFFSSSLAQDLTYTIGWAVFAVAMLVAGIAVHSRAARVAAIVLLLRHRPEVLPARPGRLGGLYRVGSLLGLAVAAVLFSILVQRFVVVKKITTAGSTT